MRRADSILKPIVKNLGIEESLRLAEIRRNWNALFGEPLSSHMSPAVLSNGELLLTADSPVWLQQLKFCKGDILSKLGVYGIRDIRFRLGRVSSGVGSGEKTTKRKIRGLTDTEQEFIRETMDLTQDDGLKKSLRRTLEKAITSEKTKIR